MSQDYDSSIREFQQVLSKRGIRQFKQTHVTARDKVTMDTNFMRYEGVVLGDAYYDAEWSLWRQPVLVTRIIASGGLDPNDPHDLDFKEGSIYHDAVWQELKKGWLYTDQGK